ncbi:hypothetical protein HDV00_010115, partial [Rhizophlyctis rosea]
MSHEVHYSDEEDAYSDSHSSHGDHDDLDLDHLPRDSASPHDLPNTPDGVGGAAGDKPMRTRKRTRTSRACDSCRKKRTKCTGEQPCSTCVSFDTQCIYTPRVKKRGPVTKKDQFSTLESRLKTVESLLTNLLTNSGTPTSPSVPAVQHAASGLSGISAADAFNPNSPHTGPQNYGEDPLEGVIMQDKEGGAEISLYFGGRSHAFASIWKRAPEYGHCPIQVPFPAIAAPPFRTYTKEELSVIPCSPILMHHLVDFYFENVHPFFPMISREFFTQHMGMYSPGQPLRPFVMLLTSVLAAAAQYDGQLESWGVKSPVDFQWDLVGRIIAMIHHFEEPHLFVCQSLVLIAIAGLEVKTKRNLWSRCSVAIRMAQEIGLHRTLPYERNKTDPETDTRRRTFFCCYILDRFAAISTGRPVIIRDEEWDTMWPTAVSPTDADLVANLIRQVRLCFVFGKIAKYCTAVVRPDRQAFINDVQSLLSRWFADLPPALQVPPTEWGIHSALYVMYHTALILFHRVAYDTLEDATCIASATEITNILHNMALERARPSVAHDPQTPNSEVGGGKHGAGGPKVVILPPNSYGIVSTIAVWVSRLQAGKKEDAEMLRKCIVAFRCMRAVAPMAVRIEGFLRTIFNRFGIDDSLVREEGGVEAPSK